MRIIVTYEVKQSIDRNNSETLVFRLHDYTHLPTLKDFRKQKFANLMLQNIKYFQF